MTQFTVGKYVIDDELRSIRRASFDELPARERAQHLAASISGGKETDALRLRQHCDSVLREANIRPLNRAPKPTAAHRCLTLDQLIDLAATALIDFSIDLTRAKARIAERLVYALAWVIR